MNTKLLRNRRFGWVRCFALTTLAVALSACAGMSPNGEGPRAARRVIIDGLDVNVMNAVFVRGFDEIKERAYAEPQLDKLFTAGLAGLSTIDPDLRITAANGRLGLAYKDREVSDLGQFPDASVLAWSATTIRALVVARRFSPKLKVADDEAIYKAIFKGALTTIDPYSRYASRQDAARNRLVRNGVIGLGVRVELVDDGALIKGIVEKGPADLAGLRIDDVITHANGVPLVNQSLADVRRRLDGVLGAVVRLTAHRPGAQEALTVTAALDLVVPDTVHSSLRDGILELVIGSFNQRTAFAVERAVTAAREENGGKLRGIVLDLRGDPGGLLDQAIDIADLFLDEGTIANLYGRHPGANQFYAAHRGDIAEGVPIALIIDGKSASATEIVVAALQENRRAVVVGTVSWGKGSVQTIRRLPNGGELTLTWAHVVTSQGVSLNGLGLLPNICLSGDEASLSGIIDTLFARDQLRADIARQWQSPADNPETHRALRAACPAKAYPGRAIDLDVARRIVSDPALMALALPDTAPQLAVKP